MKKTWTSLFQSRLLIKGISLLLFICLFLLAGAQNDRKALEKKRKQKEEEIALTKRLLSQTTKKKDQTLNHLRLLNKQIKIREELINAVGNELKGIDEQIAETHKEIDRLNNTLEERKKEYGDMLYTVYKTRSVYGEITFYLSAESFNQAVRRIQYVRQLGESRTRQLEKILETQNQILAELESLKQSREDKTLLLSKKEQEKGNLLNDKEEENRLAGSLRNKEKELKADLAAKQKAARQLDYEIKKLIAEEIRKANEKKKTAGTGSSSDLASTPEAKALSASFTSNRGKLPWPVEKGFVIKGFGEHKHPTLPGIVTVNNGIDIVTTGGSNARAVFEGEVRAIFSVPGMQNAVMINHGEFFTVYTHLETLYVKKGDKLKTKQNIGSIFKDEDNKTIVHFEMWKGSTKLDPEDWIFNSGR